MTLDEHEMFIVHEAMRASFEQAETEVQKILEDVDQEAAKNGNLWLQGRISGLLDVISMLRRAIGRGKEMT